MWLTLITVIDNKRFEKKLSKKHDHESVALLDNTDSFNHSCTNAIRKIKHFFIKNRLKKLFNK